MDIYTMSLYGKPSKVLLKNCDCEDCSFYISNFYFELFFRQSEVLCLDKIMNCYHSTPVHMYFRESSVMLAECLQGYQEINL